MNDGSPILLIFMALAVVALFVMSSRARKRQADATKFRTTLEPGQQVMTTSGLFATVVAVDGDKITLATSGGQESVWLLQAIAKLVEDEEPEEQDDDAESEDDATATSTTTAAADAGTGDPLSYRDADGPAYGTPPAKDDTTR